MTIISDFRRSLKSLRRLVSRARNGQEQTEANNSLLARFVDVFLRTWDLGFTAFGGPPVHFQIIYARFVDGKGGAKWIDEQTYQELFAVCQGLPGPASTKMLFCITLLHAGLLPALFVFVLWSLPGALAMYSLSLGVQRISEVLPLPVYALLSGLNASTVGIIALAAVQLAEKAIKDDITRILVVFGACAGVCYNALWYFPILMVIGGLTTFLWDGHLKPKLTRFRAGRKRRNESALNGGPEDVVQDNAIALEAASPSSSLSHRKINTSLAARTSQPRRDAELERPVQAPAADIQGAHSIRLRVGICIVVGFFASFIAVIIARALPDSPPLSFSLFSNMYLAGTIIFGGGPVVIPLLRSYVVDPGWVSGRDFLLGLAIIQALPGPNFNFAVYLGALTLQKTQLPTIVGSLLAFIGIFTPGLTLAVAVQGFWRVMRTKQWVLNVLRGVNATAVGLVFTAVYRLWGIGYLTPEVSSGQSLALEPWWVVITAVTYAESAWFKVPPPVAIIIGAVLGLCWYGAVGR
ncbi:putative chromate ion transporter [Tothia fuscella]|uniref:Chromate ion transporter n=1 Tax=Tothia fuscella TaxID=1048955 RepID=A0A9P4TTK6_9PEZI|nr:putative chromate ion transporter [Tothia fuscella]